MAEAKKKTLPARRAEELEPGEQLEIVIDDGESVRNVPRRVTAEGHRILRVRPLEGAFELVIEKGE